MLRFWLRLLSPVFAVLLYCIPAAGTEENAAPVEQKSKESSKFVLSVSAQTGYQHMDLNFRAPIITNNVVGLELFTRSPVHLRLHDGNLWVSGIAADAKIGGLSGFFDWKIAKPREAEVISPSEPFWGGLYSAKWHDCNLKWWAVNAGAGFDILNRFSIVDHLTLQAGLKAEHLNLGLGTPIDDPTLIPQFKLRFGDDYRGYLESELLIPWMGFQVQASRLNASVRFSPYAYANVKIPFSYYFVGTPLIGYEHEVYTFRNHGVWLEGNLAYEVLRIAGWSCTLWGQASWLWIHGRAYSTYREDLYLSGAHVGQMTDASSAADSKYNTGTYGIGLRISYNF